jgi:Predicted acetyltransferase
MVLDYRQEWLELEPGQGINGSWGLQRKEYENYEIWLNDIENLIKGISKNPNINVPATTYFALSDGKMVGNIQCRHYLNDYLLRTYGHVGYAVRPAERRKGYATKMLSLVTKKYRDSGVGEILISCDKENVASKNTIIKSGGVFESEFVDENENVIQRYWIKTDV